MSRAKSTYILLVFLFGMSILFLAPQTIRAQDGGDDEQSAELKRLNALKAEAEARKAIAEAKAAELKAKFPDPKTTPLEGKTTVNEESIERTAVAYVSVAGAADKIARSLYNGQRNIKKIAIYSDADIKLLVAYSAAIKRVQAFKTKYTRLIDREKNALSLTSKEPPLLVCTNSKGGMVASDVGGAGFPLALEAATSVLGNFTDLLSFLRTDVELKGSVFDVNDSVIVAEVFRALRASFAGKGIELYYPGEFPPNFDVNNNSPMLDEIEGIYAQKDEADYLAAQINARIAKRQKRIAAVDTCIGTVNARIGKLTRPEPTDEAEIEAKKKSDDPDDKLNQSQKETLLAKLNADLTQYDADKAKQESDIETLQLAIKPLADLNAQLELLLKDMVKVDEKSGLTPLITFLQSENLQRLMKDDQSYWLKVKVVKAGGNIRIKRNLILDVFTFGNRISYNGASTVEYHLYDNKGRSIMSDTVTKYFDFIKGKKVEALSDKYDQ
jgi:hypothetical protein